MALTRRQLLRRTAPLAAGLWGLGGPGVRLAFGAAGPAPALLVIFLRGGADALSLVAPTTGADRQIYEAERPSLKLAAAGDGGLLALDGRFGLHPAARELHKLYTAKRLAIVHAVGLTEPNRSHFEAQAMIELGRVGAQRGESGWLTRYLLAARKGGAGEAVAAIGGMLPTALAGTSSAVVLTNVRGFGLGGPGPTRPFQRLALRELYAGSDWLSRLGTEALDAVDRLEGLAPKDYVPAAGVDYPKNELGNRLKTVAELMKLPLGLVAVEVDMGGWDTHKYQGNGAEGQLADKVAQLSSAVEALLADVAPRPLTVVVMSEFGRRVKENANRGTDHGHGGVMLVAGTAVRGGKVYGAWPGLSTEQLYDRADLAVTTDYRQVLHEVLGALGPTESTPAVFPGFKPTAALGLMGS